MVPDAIRQVETKRLRNDADHRPSPGVAAIPKLTEAAECVAPRRIALHEAGHAIAFCYYGCGFDYIAVYSKTRAQKTGEQACCCASETFSHHLSRSDITADDRQSLRQEAVSDIVISLAGCAAEKRYRRISIAAALCDYGRNDHERALAVAAFVARDSDDQDALMDLSFKEAQRFVRMPVIWGAIANLADLVQERRRVSMSSRVVKAIVDPVLRLRDQNSAGVSRRERIREPSGESAFASS